MIYIHSALSTLAVRLDHYVETCVMPSPPPTSMEGDGAEPLACAASKWLTSQHIHINVLYILDGQSFQKAQKYVWEEHCMCVQSWCVHVLDDLRPEA